MFLLKGNLHFLIIPKRMEAGLSSFYNFFISDIFEHLFAVVNIFTPIREFFILTEISQTEK